MKNTTTILTIAILTIFGFNTLFAQYSEGFENNFYPTGWNGKGFSKTNAKKKNGSYSAISSQNNANSNDNYMKIENVATSSSASVSFSYIGHNGNKNTRISVFVKNSAVIKGDSVLITTLTPNKSTWQTANIELPEAYQNTENTSIYFVINSIGNGGNDKVYIDEVNSSFPMPVEMKSFTYTVNTNNVNLKWNTSSEINNKGFEVQRNSGNGWTVLGFVSANSSKSYGFADNNLKTGSYQYRLKQIDFNGNFEYFTLNSEVKVGSPVKFSLSQNYPNPFNPSTKIGFQIPSDEFVTLKVYDNAGREVLSLVNETKAAGYHTVEMKNNLTSGIYYYVLTAGSFTDTKKMSVIK
ncbi:MAG: T9SS type A sorting domain-containing protein [Ignavibacteriae bacterium]|nr:T9SS type A sorting domain-containing protein [Ignavibacteriota bacterium]